MNVKMGTKVAANAAGKDSSVINMECRSDFQVQKLEDVLHVFSFKKSLISVSSLDQKGMRTTLGGGKCIIRKKSVTVATGWIT